MLPIAFRSARQLASLVRRKRIGCLELLDLYLERVERHNPALNAIVVLDAERARERARQADRALARGEPLGRLHGVPMTVKESFDVEGLPTTWGVPALSGNAASRNALAVERLLRAGAVIFGKTNVPLHLADWQTFNAIYGTTRNPWDLERTPGGSSGGSAAALAAGLTALELGSDIGASIRNPAHYCGVYGHKPTYGIASPRGQSLPGVVAETDIAVIGPLARSADDLTLALDTVAGPDPITARGWRLALPRPRRRRLGEYRVAVIYGDAEAEVDAVVQERLRAVAGLLSEAGATVLEEARPAFDSGTAHENYLTLLRAATSRRLDDAAFADNLEALRTLDPADESYRARAMRAQALYHRDWLLANDLRHRLRLLWDDFFAQADLLLCPVATTDAFPINEQGERWERMVSVNGRDQPSTAQLFWAGYTCNFYLPATAAPAGLGANGRPVGVQIVGAQYRDHECIRFARLLERELGGFVPPPGYGA